MKKSETLRTKVDPDTKAELERRAEREDVSVAHLVRKAIRALLAASLIALVIIPAASADLRMIGQVKPRHWTWLAQAQQNVPLPDTRIILYVGRYNPRYQPGAIGDLMLPKPGWGGWTYQDERYLLLHELGHALDFTSLTPADRNNFRAAIGVRAGWNTYVKTRSWRTGFVSELPPYEMFAEVYAACALGMTKTESDDAGNLTYGWGPAEWVDQHGLCNLIRTIDT